METLLICLVFSAVLPHSADRGPDCGASARLTLHTFSPMGSHFIHKPIEDIRLRETYGVFLNRMPTYNDMLEGKSNSIQL